MGAVDIELSDGSFVLEVFFYSPGNYLCGGCAVACLGVHNHFSVQLNEKNEISGMGSGSEVEEDKNKSVALELC